MKKINVLFVCMGNICRSPTAEGVFAKLLKDRQLETAFMIDSAGTHAFHAGKPADLRSQQAALERGIDLSQLRARKVIMGDFEDFDYLLAMDEHNFETMMQACPSPYQHKIKYFLDYAPHVKVREVPDPYYGGPFGFQDVLDLIEAASEGFLQSLEASGHLDKSIKL